jgi:hypothetical protein
MFMTMGWKTLFVTAALCLMVMSVKAEPYLTVAPLQVTCGPYQEILDAITGLHKEVRIGRGVTEGGAMAEFFVSPKGSWTLLITSDPEGDSCVLTGGDAWQSVGPEKKTSF